MRFALTFLLAAALLSPSGEGKSPPPATPRKLPPETCTRTSGLVLPEGFCAIVVARELDRPR